MPDRTGSALEDEQLRFVATLERMLRDQLGRKVVVELSRPHPIPSDPKVRVAAVDRDALERARKRLSRACGGGTDPAAVEAALARTREALDSFAASAAELQATVPERVGDAIEDALRNEVLPVARHIAEVRGLSSQTIRRLEHIQGDLSAERTARRGRLRCSST